MADVKSRTEDWKTRPWRDMQRKVFRLQQRILRQAQDRFTKLNVGRRL